MKHINKYVKRRHIGLGNVRHTVLHNGTQVIHMERVEDVSPVIYDDLLLERGCHLEVRRYDQ